MRTLMISAALIFGMATPAAAEVVSRGEDTFTLKFSARTEYGPGRIVRSLEGLPNWWDPAHTYTGDAAKGRIAERFPIRQNGFYEARVIVLAGVA